MARGKDKIPGVNPKNVHAFDRLNFLHQASVLMSTIRCESQESTTAQQTTTTKVKNWKGDPPGTILGPARYFNNNMKQITSRLVMRLDPNIKRAVCRRCETTLLPAITSKNSILSKPVKTAVTQCKICKAKKRYTSQIPDHIPFNSRPDNILTKEQSAAPSE